MPRDRFVKQSVGVLQQQIRQSRTLVVGAGGIGCELLKNLVTTGFGEIHLVDLDTIDLSNLNRQFLFRHAHIKKSKALVATDAAAQFNPNVTIKAYHANIKDPQFSIQWFKSFDIVFNALDNLEARRHVNKMCVVANIPLIESGTTGFNGQVQPIKPGSTQCYDCTPKQTPKSFPVCTIRSTPSQPIHCIVWAKSYLFNELFGVSEDDSPDLDHSEDAENTEEIKNLKLEAAALKKIRQSMNSGDPARHVFQKVYTDDINRLRSMEDMWKSRKPPEPLQYDDLKTKSAGTSPSILLEDQRVWNIEENMAVFTRSLLKLSQRLAELRRTNTPTGEPSEAVLTFDKDDRDALDFVAAAANLRSIVFGIEPKSEFEIKQMAGNIIPAIATTNATTAALCVLQAFKVMQQNFEKAKMVFLSKSLDRAIDREDLHPPNPACPVCGNARAVMTIDPARATLADLVQGQLQAKLGYTDFSVNTDAGVVYDPDLDDNLGKKLAELDISKDSFVTIIDDDDDTRRVNLVLAVAETELPESSSPIMLLPDAMKIPQKPQHADGDVVDDANGISETVPSQKRKREVEDEGARKKGKVNNHDAIEITEDDGAIVLD